MCSIRLLIALAVILPASQAIAEDSLFARPQVFRTFMPDAGPSAFAVVLTPDLALCYDGLRGGVNQAWSGTIDLAPTFQAKINQPAVIRGAVFYSESTPQPLRIDDPSKIPLRRFKGYRYDGDAVTFDYLLDGVAVSETLRAADGSSVVKRSWRVETGNRTLFFLAEEQSGADVTCTGGVLVSPGVWKFESDSGDVLTFTITLKPKVLQR